MGSWASFHFLALSAKVSLSLAWILGAGCDFGLAFAAAFLPSSLLASTLLASIVLASLLLVFASIVLASTLLAIASIVLASSLLASSLLASSLLLVSSKPAGFLHQSRQQKQA